MVIAENLDIIAGVPRGDLHGEFFNWVFSLLSQGGKASPNSNQTGPVFFLAGKFKRANGEARPIVDNSQTANVPRDKGIFVPLLNFYAAEADGDGSDDPPLRGLVRKLYNYIDKKSLYLKINNEYILGGGKGNPADYLAESRLFLLTIPSGAVESYEFANQQYYVNVAGTKAVAGGYAALLKLPLGSYDFEYGGDATKSYDFKTDTKQTVVVKESEYKT